MNPQEQQQTQEPKPGSRASTASLLDMIAEKGIKEDYARQLVHTEIEAQQFNHEQRLAKVFSDSGEFEGLKGKTPEQAIASAMARIQIGKYWGINPADAMRFIRFDRGKPIVENEIIAAKLQEAGWAWDLEYTEDDKTGKCTGCYLYPKKFNKKTGEYEVLKDRNGADVEIRFTEVEANNALIYEKDKWIKLSEKWNYKSWAEDMFYTKCIARFKRRYAPGVMAGARTMDEISDEPPTPAADPEPERNPFTVTAAPPKEESKAPIQETKATVVETVTHKPEPEVHKSEPVQSGAPEPEKVTEMPKAEEPPKRRGRPPATPKPEGAAAMEQLKKEVPPEAPNGFQATNDDLPDNIAAAPHAEKPQAPAEPLSQVERLTAIKALLVRDHGKYLESWCKKENIARAGKEPAITPSAYAHHLLKTFIKAFLKVNTLPTPPDVVFARHLPLFESFAKLYGGQLISKPQEEGAKAGESWAIFVRKIDEWPTGVKDLAKTVAAERYPDEVTSLLEFLDVAGISTPDAEMMAFFKLLRIGNQTLQAAREAAKKRGCSLVELTGNLNLDLADEKQVLSAIAGAVPVQSGAGETGQLWDE